MSFQGLENIVKRNIFYAENYKRALLTIAILIPINFFLSGYIYYQSKSYGIARYFPTTTDGQIIEIPDLFDKVLTDEQLKTWTKSALMEIFSYDFVTYRKALQDIRKHFTSLGHQEFLRALKESNNLNTIKENKQTVRAVIDNEAEIVGSFSGKTRHVWKVKVPVRIIYENGVGKKIVQDVTTELIVVRESPLRAPYGVAIAQLIYY